MRPLEGAWKALKGLARKPGQAFRDRKMPGSGIFRGLFPRLRAIPGLFSRRTLARYSLRTRLALSLAGLSLASFLILGLCGLVLYEITISHIVRWHMDPILRNLVAESKKGEGAQGLGELAASLNVWFYKDADIPHEYRPDRGERELIRIERDSYAYVGLDHDNHAYAVVGKVKDLDDIEEAMLAAALVCGAVCLCFALFLSWWLMRRLVTPLVDLARSVRAQRPLEETGLCEREDELGELARAFQAREQSLRRFLVREQLFTGDVSHELRTPLTILQGAAELLESRVPESSRPVLERMERTIEGMTSTVSTMLLLARTPEQLEMRAFDMTALARREEDYVEQLLKGRDIAYSQSLPDTLMLEGNPDLATLVLHNILDNACRYTSEGSISLVLDGKGFVVRDTAPPIDEEVRRRMFERGIRGATGAPGSGLGLSLVQRGCERLGWTVSHAVWERGNEFTVLFARDEKAQAQESSRI